MTKRFLYSTCLSLVISSFACLFTQSLNAQTAELSVKGVVRESGTGLPLNQVSVSVTSTGISSATDSLGAFSITVPDLQAELIIDLPGYNKRNVFLNGREFINVSMVLERYRSLDNSYNHTLGSNILKDAIFAVSSLTAADIKNSKATSFDQTLQGRIPGLAVTEQSGMPGHRTYMNIRGISTLYGASEPLLFIDGMIHDYSYANTSLIEGFSLNPMDIVDIDDISDISVMRDGESYLGAAGSNGVININTEQKSETSTVIKFSAYGGVSMVPKKQDILDQNEFKTYFGEMLKSRGYDNTQVNTMYPWLNGNVTDAGMTEYYRYNNNTDWQDETYKPATMQKYHFFLKGGDDIATYNISVGSLTHNGLYDNSLYKRFNLRINGKINITDKFSVTPNIKLSMADNYLPNQGYSAWKNPNLATLLMAPIMAPFARDASSGIKLSYLDNTGVFDMSNPTAITTNAVGSNRNYHFLSSVNAQYKFNEHFNLSTLVGLNFNNSRENIFLPDIGIIKVDSAANSPGDFVYEFRSTQNHTTLRYTNQTASGHSIIANGGFRYMKNSYKFSKSIDLNTSSDDFKSLGQGQTYTYLRSATGDNRELLWISYFGSLKYNFRNKYFIDANLSYDGNSAVNDANRYNTYPSIGAAWRLSSENFLNKVSWLEDLKLRASYSVTGNMFSTIYDYSKLYYVSRRMNSTGVLLRELIPNENMELEKKNTMNLGMDLSVLKQVVNLHLDLFQSSVNNLIIQQELPASYGYTTYFDNGGKLGVTGVELGADTRVQAGDIVWTFGGSVSKELTEINKLEFLNSDAKSIITSIETAQFITSEGNPINAFYGYKTDGVYANTTDAAGLIGPKGVPMEGGDVKFVDLSGPLGIPDNKINEYDKTIIGDPNPDLFGGIFTTLSFKSFELSAIFNYSIGNDVFNYVKYKTESMDSYNNQSTSILGRWKNEGDITDMPRASFGDPTGNTVFSDRWIEDGSYLRLEQLSLSYLLPPKAGIYKGITIYVTGSNLLTFTKYSGYDPDMVYANSPFYMGVDYGKMPQTRSFIVGLKLDL